MQFCPYILHHEYAMITTSRIQHALQRLKIHATQRGCGGFPVSVCAACGTL